ncbi:Dihydroorotate dehydrogenase (quinone), mitochondrial [Emydomyces testavorans]|uniref:Dihydroorotate dehydrogenase (Quinone), mitochondrial n=1 Tax=Emydomyces testavorans TaxID=2070801 RepID=A0AAF0IJU6_9EURO|nr:Dihydroorotate dehydrogenase (quinone), mitochondrial [Emydomyces testavorans]
MFSRSIRLNCRAVPRTLPSNFPRPHNPSYSARFGSSDAASTAKKVAETAAAATAVSGAAKNFSPKRRLRRILWTAVAILGMGCGYVYMTDTRASAHWFLVPPLIRWMYPDAEDAHHAGVNLLKRLYRLGLHPRERGNPDGDGRLVTEVFGYRLCNPIGISGGLDKDAEIPCPLFELGPAIVEVGGCTPLPQEGNPKVRVFRIPSQNALINRYGLNSKGADHMASVLKKRVREFAYANGYGLNEAAEKRVLDGEAGVPPGSLTEGKLLAVQIAKNKTTPDHDIEAIKRDYVYCVDRLAKYADILVVNVSSPNTPGLRDLQRVEPLTKLLKGVVAAAHKTDRRTKPYVMVKVSPDEDSEEQVNGICDAVWASGVDGVIVGNTTNRRPDPLPKGYQLPVQEQITLREKGGFSGPQLFDRTVSLVSRYRNILETHPARVVQSEATNDSAIGDKAATPSTESNSPWSSAGELRPAKVLFASGGITNGKQALAVLDAGASVAMLYTGLVYGGSGTITRMKEEMREITGKTSE